MDIVKLAAMLERPEVHKRILGQYKGAYSLGVTQVPERGDEFAFLLRIEDEKTTGLPPEITGDQAITIDGQRVQVIVQGSFRRPRAF